MNDADPSLESLGKPVQEKHDKAKGCHCSNYERITRLPAPNCSQHLINLQQGHSQDQNLPCT
jgi:hypothetical protein